MPITTQIANQFRDLYFGGNWTGVDFRSTLTGVDWKQATARVDSLNSIAALVFHTNYYVTVVLKVLKTEPVKAHDKYSFDLPPIESEQDWSKLLAKHWADAEDFALLVEEFPEQKLWETFMHEKYGNYYRNLHGVIEHSHYHLGQIVIIKKCLQFNGFRRE